jgi:hypothetical protein
LSKLLPQILDKTWQALPTLCRRHDHGSLLLPSILTSPFYRNPSLAHMTLKPFFMTFPRQLRCLLPQVLDRLDEWFLQALLHFLDVLRETVDRLPLRVVAIDLLRHLELPQTNSNSLQNIVDPGMTYILQDNHAVLMYYRYYGQDDNSGRLMTQTLATLPPSQRAPFSRLQASIRSGYHRSINARRHAEFQAQLSATSPGGSLMPHARVDPRGPEAQKGMQLLRLCQPID